MAGLDRIWLGETWRRGTDHWWLTTIFTYRPGRRQCTPRVSSGPWWPRFRRCRQQSFHLPSRFRSCSSTLVWSPTRMCYLPVRLCQRWQSTGIAVLPHIPPRWGRWVVDTTEEAGRFYCPVCDGCTFDIDLLHSVPFAKQMSHNLHIHLSN